MIYASAVVGFYWRRGSRIRSLCDGGEVGVGLCFSFSCVASATQRKS